MKTLVLAEHNDTNLSAATLSVVEAAKQLGREVDLLLTHNSCTSVLEEARTVEGVAKVKDFRDPFNCFGLFKH
jgi:electron transfer flavoprotein alpha subunit